MFAHYNPNLPILPQTKNPTNVGHFVHKPFFYNSETDQL